MSWLWWALLGWAAILAAFIVIVWLVGEDARERNRERAHQGSTMRDQNGWDAGAWDAKVLRDQNRWKVSGDD